ncbi:MAG: hypothetical protein GC134_09100 [Proteobacteria bacterium]|nr:hypothetical protein [Pseudomonadota bacterium]
MPVCSNCYGGGYSTIFEGELVGIKRLAKQLGIKPEELTGAIPPGQTPAGAPAPASGFTSDAPLHK